MFEFQSWYMSKRKRKINTRKNDCRKDKMKFLGRKCNISKFEGENFKI